MITNTFKVVAVLVLVLIGVSTIQSIVLKSYALKVAKLKHAHYTKVIADIDKDSKCSD